jgi:hypothetical protein
MNSSRPNKNALSAMAFRRAITDNHGMDIVTTLYRYFDAEGRLLYVGITGQTAMRGLQHARYSQWWPRVASATYEHFATRAEAESAELAAITNECPRYNRDGTGTRMPAMRYSSMRAVRVPPPEWGTPAWQRAQEVNEKVTFLMFILRNNGWPPLDEEDARAA